MYNTVLGALPLNPYGKAFYQSNYHHHARKMYFDGYGNLMEDEWPCCSGTLPQVAMDYRISTYFRDKRGVYANLFIPSTVHWTQTGAQVSLKQSGSFPLGDTMSFEISTTQPVHFALRLRIPKWARGPTIWINGSESNSPPRPGTFASIERKWTTGDRVELRLPRELEVVSVDSQHPDTVALTYGPLVLFAAADETPKVTRSQLREARQQSQAEWLVDTSRGPLRMVPFWALGDALYFTYLSV